MKNTFWGTFSRIIECDKSLGHFVRIQRVLWQLLWKWSYKINTQTLRGCWKDKFLKKKGIVSSEKRYLGYFFRSIEHYKCQATIDKGPKGLLTFFVEVIKFFL